MKQQQATRSPQSRIGDDLPSWTPVVEATANALALDFEFKFTVEQQEIEIMEELWTISRC